MNKYRPLQGRHMKRNRNSKVMECALRYLVEVGVPRTADEIYFNMTTKTGKNIRNSRNGPCIKSFKQKISRFPHLRRHYGKATMRNDDVRYSCDEITYNRAFPQDPMTKRSVGNED